MPPGVVAVEAHGAGDEADLLPEEAATLAAAVDKRRREFAAGRSCARQALARLGFPAAPILPAPSRAPIWPDGVVGSITHCAGYGAAAVGRRADFLTIGIDAEVHRALPDGVVDRVASVEERQHLSSLGSQTHWDCVLFSAKESIYKAWSPVTSEWLDFEDVAVTFAPESGVFEAAIRRRHRAWPLATVTGRFAVSGSHVLTTVVLRTGGFGNTI